ncbi:hypothetical protein AHiyo8_pI70030 (plasmid) [Arthrobacter sp. Hiyo8]|nr:hypothetical protein AHiyo8_pI70030 [Arthrobacter sp. Hiyo8]
MTEPEKDRAREALERAMDDLLEGRVPGPSRACASSNSPASSATGSPTTTPT